MKKNLQKIHFLLEGLEILVLRLNNKCVVLVNVQHTDREPEKSEFKWKL